MIYSLNKIKQSIISSLIKKGKKFKIKKILFLFWWKLAKNKHFRKKYIFEKSIVSSIWKCRPLFTVYKKRKGKSGVVIIPKFLKTNRQLRISRRWIGNFILRPYFKDPLQTRIENGLYDIVSKKISDVLIKKKDWELLAFQNRYSSHYRWWKGV